MRKPRERDHSSGDPGVDGITLNWIFKKWDVGAWTVLTWYGQGEVGGSCKHGNEPSNSMKCGGIFH